MTTIIFKHGNIAAASSYVGEIGEIWVNEETGRIHVSDGVTPGGVLLSLDSDQQSVDQLTNDSLIKKTELTNVSQLNNDANYWSQSTLTKVSQLTNDYGYITGYCTYLSTFGVANHLFTGKRSLS